MRIGEDSSKGTTGSPPVHIGQDEGKTSKDSPPTQPPPSQIDYIGDVLGESKDYNKLAAKGVLVDNDLHEAMKSDQPDVAMAELTDNYDYKDYESNIILSRTDDLTDAFKIIDLDPSTTRTTMLRVCSKKTSAEAPTVAEGEFYGNDGTIIGEARFKANDQNPPDKQMKPSEITFAMWKRVASNMNIRTNLQMLGTSDNTGKFRNFIGRNIQSRSTIETMISAHKNTGQTLDSPGIFKRTDTDAAKVSAFQALMGTDFMSSLNYMVKDHHVILGNIHITEIHTFPRAYNAEAQSGRQKAAILVIFDGFRQ